MGTRHLIAVVSNGEYKVAQYGQWDGYPSGQGTAICNFIQNEMDLNRLRSAVNECRFLDNTTISQKWVECGASPDNDSVSMDVAEKFESKYPQLSRNTGADILNLIQNGTRDLKDSLEFAGDSLFCEWAYVLDLDNETLEVYRGFNKEPVEEGERFYCFAHVQKNATTPIAKEYCPVKLIAKYPFNDATTNAMIELEKSLDEEMQ